jgi:hypothetical protein
MVDGLFGFGDWSPRGGQKQGRDVAALARAAEKDLPQLEHLSREIPGDAEISRRLSDTYLQQGRLDDYVRERLRIIADGKLTDREVCTIYNRLVDVEIGRHGFEAAQSFLWIVIEKYPDSTEAHNAKRRLEVINDNIASSKA